MRGEQQETSTLHLPACRGGGPHEPRSGEMWWWGFLLSCPAVGFKKARNPTTNAQGRVGPPPRQAGRYKIFALLCLLFLPLQAFAATEKDEARARQLFTEVRCVQCQSESIADSDAQIAGDMRREIRADIAAGRTDAEIRKELFDHYGDYVLFRPRLTLSNLILWTLPLIIVVLGGIFMFSSRRKSIESTNYTLSDTEEKKLRAILKKHD